jgi:hypothetical protein
MTKKIYYIPWYSMSFPNRRRQLRSNRHRQAADGEACEASEAANSNSTANQTNSSSPISAPPSSQQASASAGHTLTPRTLLPHQTRHTLSHSQSQSHSAQSSPGISCSASHPACFRIALSPYPQTLTLARTALSPSASASRIWTAVSRQSKGCHLTADSPRTFPC